MIRPDPRIAAYIHELTVETVVSYSHITLRTLYRLHGQPLIDELVQAHFKEQQHDSRTRLAGASQAP